MKLINLSIGYPQGKSSRVVMKGINAELHKGRLTCLIGANGAGKSTLLRTISAFQPKLGGDILIRDRKLESFSREELARLIGVVLTERPSVQHLTARQMVAMGRSPYTGFFGRLSDEDNAVVTESMRMVGIEHLAERMVHSLSDGERQKMMTAKALAQQTDVIFLDEPTAFLDYGSKVDTLQMLHQLCNVEGKTILLSTHDLELALQVADELWVMTDDKVTTGTPDKLSADGTLSRFIDRPGLHYDPTSRTIRIVDNK
ncbi:ABC transporter ATP-binding protein [Prevotella sp.]|uniref:ABC transporter ATP-binding protein n=1 Tax=Prevotella sp. TaxID=59823 RepID=UPI003FD8A6CB